MAAPSGPGGGPIGFAGGSFTGPAQAFEIIGDHGYAFSGPINTPGQDTQQTLLQFTSGSYYAVVEMQFGLRHDTSDNISFLVQLNGQEVCGYTITGGIGDSQQSNALNAIIAPYTEVLTAGVNNSSGSGIPIWSSIVGRIYR